MPFHNRTQAGKNLRMPAGYYKEFTGLKDDDVILELSRAPAH